jgi:hypothetical protein
LTKTPDIPGVPSLAGGRGVPATIRSETDCEEIILLYQLLICVIKLAPHGPAFGIEAPQIWPHFPALLVRSLLRFAAFAI